MRVIGPAQEADVVAVFLQAELRSPRFGPLLRELLADAGAGAELIERADTDDRQANALRASVLGQYRGWPDRLLFRGFPTAVSWHHAELEAADLERVRFVNDDFRLPGHEDWDRVCWFDLSQGTRLVTRAARAVAAGRPAPGYEEIYRNVRATADAIRAGVPQSELILARPSLAAPWVIVEGHTRATAYALISHGPVPALVGEAPGLERWHMNRPDRLNTLRT